MANTPKSLVKYLTQSERVPYYANSEFDELLKPYMWGDANYDNDRQSASSILAKKGLKQSEIDDVLDAFITKSTHNNNGKNSAYLRRKVGKFETGNDWLGSQKLAQSMLDENPDAEGVLYGFRYEDEEPRGNTGLKKPLLVYGDDLTNIARSLEVGKGKQRFQFDTLYNRR